MPLKSIYHLFSRRIEALGTLWKSNTIQLPLIFDNSSSAITQQRRVDLEVTHKHTTVGLLYRWSLIFSDQLFCFFVICYLFLCFFLTFFLSMSFFPCSHVFPFFLLLSFSYHSSLYTVFFLSLTFFLSFFLSFFLF